MCSANPIYTPFAHKSKKKYSLQQNKKLIQSVFVG